MRIVGVVAEYDPFHRGHAYALQQARERSGADYVIAVMSCCFTQRGAAAMLSPSARTEMALACGADAVIALPAFWSLRDAEHFALGGVRLLQMAGCAAISFGCENDSLPLLTSAARMLEDPTPAMLAAIHGRLDAGLGYPAAMSAALQVVMPEAETLLSGPNNQLAVCYLRAAERLGANLEAFPVKREGSYRATSIGNAPASATAVRGAIARGDWASACGAMPDEAADILRRESQAGRALRPDALDQAMLYRLRTMTPQEWEELPGLSEGIDGLMRKAVSRAATAEQLFEAASSRRYPTARLRRMAAHALLRVTDDALENTPLPPAVWLLGFRRDAKPLIAHLRALPVPVLTRGSELPQNEEWFLTERRAWDVWSLGTGGPADSAVTHHLVKV